MEDTGFTNIEVKDLNDLKIGFLHSEGDVKKVEIIEDFSADTSFESSDWFEQDAKIVVYYHSFPDKK